MPHRDFEQGVQLQANDSQAENGFADPFATSSRPDKPSDSNIVCEETEHHLNLEIAPLGFWKSTPGRLFRLWFLGFMSVQALVMLGIVPALLNGKVQGNPAMGWLTVGAFTAFSTAILLYRWNKAIQSGTVSISKGSLRFFERDLFGRHESLWHLNKIAEVQVSLETEKNAEGTLNWRHYLKVQLNTSSPPLGKPPRTWFCNRSKEELEWIATKINERLPSLDPRL